MGQWLNPNIICITITDHSLLFEYVHFRVCFWDPLFFFWTIWDPCSSLQAFFNLFCAEFKFRSHVALIVKMVLLAFASRVLMFLTMQWWFWLPIGADGGGVVSTCIRWVSNCQALVFERTSTGLLILIQNCWELLNFCTCFCFPVNFFYFFQLLL